CWAHALEAAAERGSMQTDLQSTNGGRARYILRVDVAPNERGPTRPAAQGGPVAARGRSLLERASVFRTACDAMAKCYPDDGAGRCAIPGSISSSASFVPRVRGLRLSC